MIEIKNKKIDLIRFPDVSNCNEDGLLAMGGDLNLSTLVSAYSQGIFPWFNDDQPILWWSPDPRMVLFPKEVKISRSLRKTINKNVFQITCNQAFEDVINACALRGEKTPFEQQEGTWITDDMQNAYNQLFDYGYAHSVEVWQEGNLVGGLYGVCLGKVFFGESMFSRVRDASKVAFVSLAQSLAKQDFTIIDCQVSSDHLLSLGAREIPRNEFMQHLKDINIQQTSDNFEQTISHASCNNAINKT